ncbi:MAG: rod shape-determining protein RodA [Candidatus Doudnabacteria bacterium]|nr:rod shape-determining protein RodA [Candidatus Doudnabacteria bacterium]
MKSFSALFRYFDLYVFGSSILLLFLGLLMIYSTTLESESNLLLRQIIFAGGGLLGMVSLAFYDYRNLKKITPWLYLLMIASLLAVWLLGPTIRGSARWIDLGFFRFQPAEFAKLIMVIVMAKYLDQQGEKLKAFRYVFLSLVYVSFPVVLILIEPDLGSAVVVFLTWFAMLLFSRISKKHLAILILIFTLLSIFSWASVLQDYQKQRLHTFLDPYQDPQGQGYNVLQSIIAVGSGELFGRGLGRGLQSQLKFLPERQTDFIFASTAEELGFFGSLFILGLFLLLFVRLLKTIIQARDNFGMYLGTGILFMLLIQVVVNVGMNIGLLPVTGIPLPLLSYGGSSLLTTFLALGIIQSIVARQKAVRFAG